MEFLKKPTWEISNSTCFTFSWSTHFNEVVWSLNVSIHWKSSHLLGHLLDKDQDDRDNLDLFWNFRILLFTGCVVGLTVASGRAHNEYFSELLLPMSLLSQLARASPCLCSSVQFSWSVVSNSLQPHEPQHVRPPCLSPTPGVHPNPCLSSQWCHPTISSSVIPFSSCPQSFQHQGLFQWVSSSH